jgi:hypothetical protein
MDSNGTSRENGDPRDEGQSAPGLSPDDWQGRMGLLTVRDSLIGRETPRHMMPDTQLQ